MFSQFQNGVENPIAFAIRTLSKSEKSYCVTRRELLVIVEFDKQHRHFLAKYRILHWNCSCPFSFVVLAKVPEGQLARWIEFLSTFDFEIQYRTEERQLMLMHFPVDPMMSVVSGVRVGSHRNECLLLMWVFRL